MKRGSAALAGVCAIAIVAGAAVAIVEFGGGDDAGGTAAAAEVARAYVEAYDRRDGDAICAAFTDELREYLERTWEKAFEGRRQWECEEVVRGFIGYQEESDTPKFEHVDVLDARAEARGSAAVVGVHERYRYSNVKSAEARSTFRDTIHLVDEDGRWRVAKLGGIFYFSRSAYQIPETFLDPPVTADEAERGAPLPPARARCVGRRVYSFADPAGEAPAPLDLRRVTARVDATGNLCLGVVLAAAPRVATMVTYEIEQPVAADSKTFRRAELSVRIGHRGVLRVAGFGQGQVHAQAGVVGDEFVVVWRARQDRFDGRKPFRLAARSRSFQQHEPLVRRPLEGHDEAASEANAPTREPVDDWVEQNALGSRARRGAEVFAATGCVACHTYAGVGSSNLNAPDLTREGCRRRGLAWQIRYLTRLDSRVHASYARLSDAQIRALAAFLEGSRGAGGRC